VPVKNQYQFSAKSHLETVGAVIEGITRAKQDKYFPNDFSKYCQSPFTEMLPQVKEFCTIVQMAQLDGYKTEVRFILSSTKVGFTTNYQMHVLNLLYRRKVTLSPVLHVNADD
jgi:2-oxoglutarate dehydrogenase E1 component